MGHKLTPRRKESIVKCLAVFAHPLEDSLCRFLANKTVTHLEKKGYRVTVKDLYRENFNPVLTGSERASYYGDTFDSSRVHNDIEQLQQTQCLVLIFPTWWFGFPAILKGWFDRVWAPGFAYNHSSGLGAITPCLDNLKEVKVITTLGSPWWVDFFVLRKPVQRVLKTALLGACTRKCSFDMLSFYKCENLSQSKVAGFIKKIRKRF